MTDSEIKLLSRGLKYTPTPRMNNSELKTDVKEYTRRLRLKEFFSENRGDESRNTDLGDKIVNKVKNKSQFIPNRGRNSTLD